MSASSSQLGHRKPSVVKALADRCRLPSRDPLELHSLSSPLLLSLLRRLDGEVLIGGGASAKGLTGGRVQEGEVCWAAGGTAAGAVLSTSGAGLLSR